MSKYERGERGLDDARLRAWLGALGLSAETFDAALERQLDQRRPAPVTLST